MDCDSNLLLSEILTKTHLSLREKIVLNQYYYHDLTERQIADNMAIKRSRVYYTRVKAIKKLRLVAGWVK